MAKLQISIELRWRERKKWMGSMLGTEKVRRFQNMDDELLLPS
jgi:hypothetical protein